MPIFVCLRAGRPGLRVEEHGLSPVLLPCMSGHGLVGLWQTRRRSLVKSKQVALRPARVRFWKVESGARLEEFNERDVLVAVAQVMIEAEGVLMFSFSAQMSPGHGRDMCGRPGAILWSALLY